MKPDLTAGVLGIGVSIVVFASSFTIAPPRYEPLGAGAVPIAAAVGLFAGSLILLATTVARHLSGHHPVGGKRWVLVPRPATLALTVTAIALYIVLFASPIGFRGATLLFVVAAAVILGARTRRDLIWLMLVAPIVAFGCFYLFTRIFVVDLL